MTKCEHCGKSHIENEAVIQAKKVSERFGELMNKVSQEDDGIFLSTLGHLVVSIIKSMSKEKQPEFIVTVLLNFGDLFDTILTDLEKRMGNSNVELH